MSFSIRDSKVLLLAVALVAAAASIVPLSALAQGRDTGTLVVRVMDPDGQALPGVLVTVRGPLGSRTEYSGTDGTTRFPGLDPGMYTATFSLDGFKTVVREQLRVSVGRTISVDVGMELASVEETITVTGESPMVDVKSTNVGNLYTDELIDYAPTASGIWAGVLDHVPGVVQDVIDVGGGASGQQAVFSARGSGWDQNTYNINGANTTDPHALGASSFYYSIGSFEEVGVSTASHDMEIQAPGVVLNMVTKTGSNDWHAAAKFFYENDSFVADNVDAELEARGASEGNPNTLLRDFDVQGGGPIVRNKAWFFVDYWYFDVERLIIGLPPDEVDDTSLENWTLNGTWQVHEDHKLSLRYFTDRKFRGNRGAGPTRPPANAWIQDSFVDIPQAQYQGVLGPNTFVDVRFSKMDMEFPLEAKVDHPDFIDFPPTQDLATNTWNNGWPSQEVFFQRDRTQFNGSASHYLTTETHSHDLKFGGEYQETQSFSPQRRGGPFGFIQFTRNGVPERVEIWNGPAQSIFDIQAPNAQTLGGNAWGLFGQDTWTIANRVTITGGLRYDWSKTFNPAQRRLESNFPQLGPDFQALDVPAQDPTTEWSDLVPRLGVIYDLGGDGRTALKANYSRYSLQQGVTWASYLNANSLGRENYFWVDANGDGLFQFGEQTTLRFAVFPSTDFEIDDDFESPITTEASFGVEHELVNNFLFSGSFIYRSTNNILDDINIGVPYGPIAATLGVGDAYTPVAVVDPGPDGVLGTADDGGTLTAFSQDPGTFDDDRFFITNPENFGFDPFDRYRGVSLVLHKRWSNNWQLLASYDIGKAESSVASDAAFLSGAFDDPNSDLNRAGATPWDRTHLVKITGNYLIAEPIGVNIGAFLRLQSGQALVRTISVGGPGNGDFAQGAVNVRAAPPAEDTNPAGFGERFPTITIFDLRGEKQFTIGRFGVLHAYADVFNLFNTNTVVGQLNHSASNYGRVTSIVPPRVFRIGAAWDF